MNSIPASVFILCIVKLQEFAYKYGYTDYKVLAELFVDSCKIDGTEIGKFTPKILSEIRNSEPFISLDLSQEVYVYETFKFLR